MTERHSLAEWIGKLEKARILVVGDVMLDHFVHGVITRISPEAPVPVLSSVERKTSLGGAGNVVRNLLALGAKVSFVSVVGEDDGALEISARLSGFAGLRFKLVVQPGRCTTNKTRFIANNQQVLRVDSESTKPVGDAVVDAALNHAGDICQDCDVIVISDYGKGFLVPRLIAGIIGLGKALGRSVLVDPKGRDYTLYKGATLLTPNIKELGDATGMPLDGDEAVVAAAHHLMKLCDLDALLATRGADGMSLVEATGTVNHLTAQAREVFDVSGAGDTVMAVISAALGAGATMHDAARLANVAAGIVVGKVGTAVVHPQDLTNALHSECQPSIEDKVQAMEVALDRVETWRRRGYRVGFTNGIFDLLRPGHISLLSQAASLCDRLVVGLNGDVSVKTLRGEFPCQNEISRGTVLASLEAVDLVVIFDQETPRELLGNLRPDILIKGSNYLPEEVIGADLVEGYGGEVALVDIPVERKPFPRVPKSDRRIPRRDDST